MLPHFLTQSSLIRPYAGAAFSLKLAKLTMKWFSQPIRRIPLFHCLLALPCLALPACGAHHLALIWHLLALALSPRCAYLTRALRVSDLPTLFPLSLHPFHPVSHCLHTDCVCWFGCVWARWFLFLCVMHHFGLIRPQIVGIKAWPKAMLALPIAGSAAHLALHDDI